MADFLRSHLFLLAKNAGYVGRPMSKPVRQAVRSALRDYLRTTEGRSILRDVPRVLYADRGDVKSREMDERAAIEALLEELDGQAA